MSNFNHENFWIKELFFSLDRKTLMNDGTRKAALINSTDRNVTEGSFGFCGAAHKGTGHSIVLAIEIIGDN